MPRGTKGCSGGRGLDLVKGEVCEDGEEGDYGGEPPRVDAVLGVAGGI